MRLHELVTPHQPQSWTQQPDNQPQERLYHVATADQPLRFRAVGPTRIRVDELAGAATRTRYFNVLAGEQQFDLSPAPGVDLALFRVFELQWNGQLALPVATAADEAPPTPLPVWLDQLPLAASQPDLAVEPAWFAAPAAAWGDEVGLLSLASPDDPALD